MGTFADNVGRRTALFSANVGTPTCLFVVWHADVRGLLQLAYQPAADALGALMRLFGGSGQSSSGVSREAENEKRIQDQQEFNRKMNNVQRDAGNAQEQPSPMNPPQLFPGVYGQDPK